MSAPRDLVAATVRRFQVPDPDATTAAVAAILEALEREPDPHTTVTKLADALDVHVADSLAGLEVPALRQAANIADIGAGAGFPGLVLAAALPGARVDLIESSRRKCAVIDRLAAAAGLQDRARAVPARAEEWAKRGGAGAYDAATARALAPLPVICEYAAPLLRLGGLLVAWKGARDAQEEHSGHLAAAELGFGPPDVTPSNPYRGSENRHLHVYYKVTETPAKYPRRAGVAAKRPIG
ncbi:MAG TPA: 16S rRNA (guanine(527)-N(7))-methyltransferase RsmG [Vicinamibacteria bacterium]|nr:16S rRNA (guanine(527)-N(7))-methyltransferase RsmG [Vicinamibacteria bacterium]